MSNVWEVIHHASRIGGDVAIASNRTDDPKEWERAHYEALRNMRNCHAEAKRWETIADDMAEGLAKVHRAQHAVAVARLEAEEVGEGSA